MPNLTSFAVAGVLLAAVGAGGYAMAAGTDSYDIEVVMPSASNLVLGSPVQVNGAPAGKVADIETRDGKALIRLKLSQDYAPLHAGTTARVAWKAVLGERIVELEPGPEKNPEIPDGGMIEGKLHRVEVDEVLAALDEPTRAKLTSLVRQLDGTLNGSEEDLNATLRTAGPTVQALGEVLQSVGKDGEAIRALITRLHAMTSTLSARQGEVQEIVQDLSRITQATAARQEQVRAALRELPATLQAAEQTLDRVPAASRAAVPLLEELRPATRRLPSVAANLSPLLQDLRPTIADLRPTLRDTQALLGQTPRLIDTAHGVLPTITQVLDDTQPAAAFLRPYTPELVGWISNWASANANYDAHSHYARIWVQAGSANVNVNPGVVPPGIRRNPTPLPGELEGQPWTDAHGSEMR